MTATATSTIVNLRNIGILLASVKSSPFDFYYIPKIENSKRGGDRGSGQAGAALINPAWKCSQLADMLLVPVQQVKRILETLP
jgi:hypothetical protein